MRAEARCLAGAELAQALRDSRAVTLARVIDLDAHAWHVPQRAGINPIAWELGHLAWFAEFWILRGPHIRGANGLVDAARAARIAGPDAIFDSARLAHGARWQAELPDRAALLTTLSAQLEACIAAIPADEDDRSAYFHRLALFHEDMHGEAFAWLRATLGFPAPSDLRALPHFDAASEAGVDTAQIEFAAERVEIGRGRDAPGFSFDNEQPLRSVRLAAFAIDAAPVTAGQFLRFVEAGGYDDAACWPEAAGAWRARHALGHPERWRRGAGGDWQARWFDRWQPLDHAAPVIHVSAWEAEAYCRWRGRRLPSAPEWERAAREPRFRWGGSVWEWTADAFDAHPGFEPGPYHDYSLPWFGDHRELRGGSVATHRRLHHPSYRNFFLPERSDVFAGFRTAALLP